MRAKAPGNCRKGCQGARDPTGAMSAQYTSQWLQPAEINNDSKEERALSGQFGSSLEEGTLDSC